jgi:OHCU decarboxylase
MNQSIRQLNELPADRAEAELLKCCGSPRWASAMTEGRPYLKVDHLLERADNVWWSLSTEDWLEAFRSHPKIGEQKAAATPSAQAQEWSAQEQSGTHNSAADTIAALAEGNREYERRFGFIFIVCAAGKSSDEMLMILHSRLRNDPERELRIAAEEQRKITRLRLEKLLKVLESESEVQRHLARNFDR